MKALLVIVVVAAAAVWVWNHHTATPGAFCVTAPEKVCVEHTPTTARQASR